MVMFFDVEPQHLVIASFVLLMFGIAFTFMGGLNAVIWSDLVQVVLYVGAAIVVLFFLLAKIPLTIAEIIAALEQAPGGIDKLQVIDASFDLSAPFSILAVITGVALLNIGNSGLDQDTTQRLLACDNARDGNRALFISVWASIPVILIFLMIGSLLHIFYERPDLMGAAGSSVAFAFQGEKIIVFMHFILAEIPPGLLGVYITAVFTRRGSCRSVIAALISGFFVILIFQAYIVDSFGLPAALKQIAFPWQLCLGTAVATLVCMMGRTHSNADEMPILPSD